MRRAASVAVLAMFLAGYGGLESARASVTTFDFESSWSGDYAPGWQNSEYRWGEAPVGKMMQQTAIAHSGSYGMKLSAASVPESWQWWVAVNVQGINPVAMEKQYNPYISVWYYDQGHNPTASRNAAGQLFAVPDWVVADDWTDAQLGGRPWAADPNHYYAVAQDLAVEPWQDTGVGRPAYDNDVGAWVELTIQLMASDGKLHFFINGSDVGTSVRSDYATLGTENGLYTMFDDPLSGWDAMPGTIWDDFTIGSSYSGSTIVPEPATIVVWSLLGGLGIAAGYWRRHRAA